MLLFIDTNTYLSYFGADAKITSILALKKLLKDKKIDLTLLLTEQGEPEFLRNLGERLEQVRDRLNTEVFKASDIKIPNTDKRSKELLEKGLARIEKAHQKHHAKRVQIFEKEILKREKIIVILFSLARLIKYDELILKEAQLRFVKGNPPKKKNDTSYGDAINWTALLREAPVDDLTIISNDSDYAEKDKTGKKVLNRFLQLEWEEKKKKNIKLYSTLGEFINHFENKKIIEPEIIKRESQSVWITDGLSDIYNNSGFAKALKDLDTQSINISNYLTRGTTTTLISSLQAYEASQKAFSAQLTSETLNEIARQAGERKKILDSMSATSIKPFGFEKKEIDPKSKSSDQSPSNTS